MKIIQAHTGHLPAIAAIEEACFPADPWPADMIGRLIDRFAVAAEEDAVMGYLVLSTVLDEGSIDNVAVDPAFRRRGVGDALVADAIRRGREQALAFLTLEVRSGNEAALRLYEKHGFVPVGRRKNYYEKPREDAILMTLVL